MLSTNLKTAAFVALYNEKSGDETMPVMLETIAQ
jgi:hypothetical protein